MSLALLKRSLDDALRLHQAGRLEEAARGYRQILLTQPRHPDALHYLGVIAHAAGGLDEAVALIVQSLQIQAENPAALSNLAGVLKDQRQYADAIQFYEASLALDPERDTTHNNLGNVFKELGDLEKAQICYEKALTLNPKSGAALNNLGNIFKDQGRLPEAVKCYRQALALQPRSPETLSNLGVALKELGQLVPATECLRQALALQPRSEIALANLGWALAAQGFLGEALAAYGRALEINPRSSLALNNLGHALKEQGQFVQAIVCFKNALDVKPDWHLAHNNLGTALLETGEAATAVDRFRRALELQPDYHPAFSNLLFSLSYLPNQDRAAVFAEHVRFGKRFAEPLAREIQPHRNVREADRRLRVGYVSGDLRDHPVALFLEPVLAAHRKSAFEIFCYANHPGEDRVSARLQAHADHWLNIATMSDEEVAARVRQDRIDLLVDLSGHTARHRLFVFARKPAPVQVTMIGYMQTTGLAAMDYRITDEVLDPPGASEAFNTEKLVRLAAGAATFQPPADGPAVTELPALANGYVTFASFNNLAKVSPQVLATWAKILQAIPTAQLLVVGRAGNAVAATLAAHGIGAERLEMLDRQPMADYLALHGRVDFLLDTFPYNGGTTTLLAAWMGVPFVTVDSPGTAGRTGASLLGALGLPELAARDENDYIARAVDAVSDLPRLAAWRAGLRAKLAPHLGDGTAFTTQLESAFRAMWQQWCAAQS